MTTTEAKVQELLALADRWAVARYEPQHFPGGSAVAAAAAFESALRSALQPAGLPELPEPDWLAGGYAQAWRASTVDGWAKENAARYTVPLYTADQMRTYAAACARAAVPDGWCVAPLEPTDEMIDATYTGQHCSDIYRDMLAARPTKPGA